VEETEMKDQILVVGRLTDETKQIRKHLIDGGQFVVDLATTAPEAIDKITRDKPSLMIMNVENFTRRKVQLATDLRTLGFHMPIMVVANIIASNTYQILGDLTSTVLLEKPFELKDLSGLSEKLIDGRAVKQRIFRRFYTDEEADLQLFRSGQNISSKIRNLSKGGAFIEYKGPAISVGEMLRLNIDLKQVARRYEVNAKVVWSAKVSPWGEDPGVGVQFVKDKDVYQNLLRKI
jgi:Tfp pilus assembly protein PilZ